MDWSRRRFLAGMGAASLAGRLQGQGPSADLVLYNGKIVTVDDAFSIHQAIVIQGRADRGRRRERAQKSI